MKQPTKRLPQPLIQTILLGLLFMTTSCGTSFSTTSTTTSETTFNHEDRSDEQPVTFHPDVALTALGRDIIGPKQDSKVELTLDPQNITLAAGRLQLPIVWTNTSDHTIAFNKLTYDMKVYEGTRLLYAAHGHQVEDIPLESCCMIGKGKDIKLDCSLPEYLTSYITGNYATHYTCEVVTKSAIDHQILGKLKQPFQVKIGPIPGESKTEIGVLNNIILHERTNKTGYTAIFSFTVKNTGKHPIDLNKVLFDITARHTIAMNNVLIGPFNAFDFPDTQYALESTALLNPEKNHPLSIEIELGNLTEQTARDYLAKHIYQLKITMKTIDGSYIGTGNGQVEGSHIQL